MTSYINTEGHLIQLREILKAMEDENYLTSTDINQINALVDKNMKWIADNLKDIETWLDNETLSSLAESTTLGSSSLIASFLTITVCILEMLSV